MHYSQYPHHRLELTGPLPHTVKFPSDSLYSVQCAYRAKFKAG